MYNISKIRTGDCLVVFSKGNILSDTEIFVEESERIRLGLPKETKIATHIANLIVVNEILKITRTHWFKKEIHYLSNGVWVFQESESGMTYGLLENLYPNKDLGDEFYYILTPKNPINNNGYVAFVSSCLNQWANSVTYGFANFLIQPLHTILGFNKAPNFRSSMICSQSYANNINAAALISGLGKFFESPETTNPFEVTINNNLIRQEL